jgi:dinuclear metal center YbgI/SA1388 family protein
MEELAPPELAEEWDNPGLQAGSPHWPVQKVVVALDATPEVVSDACDQGADLLITHHPLLFRPIRRIDYSTPLGRVIELACRRRLSIFCAHTNLDWAEDGLNDAFSAAIGLCDAAILAPLGEAAGLPGGQGRIGNLKEPMSLAEFAANIRAALGVADIRAVGDLGMQVSRAAVCTGSGSGLLGAFFASDADVFVSGDLRYHDARDTELQERGLIDIGHFASEHLMVDLVRRRLAAALEEHGHSVAVVASDKESDPFVGL